VAVRMVPGANNAPRAGWGLRCHLLLKTDRTLRSSQDRVSGLGLIDWPSHQEKNAPERSSLSHLAAKGCATRYSVNFARLGC